MKRGEPTAGAKVGTPDENRRQAAVQEIGRILTEELDFEELLKLDMAGMEERVTEVAQSVIARFAKELAEKPVRVAQDKKTRKKSTV